MMKFKQRLVTLFLLVFIVVLYLWTKNMSLRSPVVPVNIHGKNLAKNSVFLDNIFDIDKRNALEQNNLISKTLRTARNNNDPHRTSLGENYISTTSKSTEIDQKLGNPWEMWNKMVTNTLLTSNSSFGALQVNTILNALRTSRITKVAVGFRGTQLKATMFLEKNQRVVFKPKRYERDFIIRGKPYGGFDRHNGEIAAFHIDRLLGFYRAPPVTGRVVNLTTEILPVTKDDLKETFFNQGGNTCFYGVCYYCKPEEAACGNGDIMEGSITLWLPPGWNLVTSRHPWQRTYSSKGRKARWETDPTYCNAVMKTPPYDKGPRLTSIIDTVVFDFLIGNADRHHYETFQHLGSNGLVLHLDNGKSFGNPETDEMSILAPLYQCCRILRSTWHLLNNFNNPNSKQLSERLRESLSTDPTTPVLSENHLKALDRRLQKIIKVVERCLQEHSPQMVLVAAPESNESWEVYEDFVSNFRDGKDYLEIRGLRLAA